MRTARCDYIPLCVPRLLQIPRLLFHSWHFRIFRNIWKCQLDACRTSSTDNRTKHALNERVCSLDCAKKNIYGIYIQISMYVCRISIMECIWNYNQYWYELVLLKWGFRFTIYGCVSLLCQKSNWNPLGWYVVLKIQFYRRAKIKVCLNKVMNRNWWKE